MKEKGIIVTSCILFFLVGLGYGQEEIIENGYNKILYPNGNIASEGMMRNGKPDEYWKTYYPTGVIKSEGNRKNHLLDSTWIFFSESGDTLQKINYVLDKRNGFSITYNTDPFSDPINKGKILSKELFVNDQREGISYYYFSNGILKEEVEYTDNRKNGISKEYNEEGRLITIKTYHNGILTDRERINRVDDEGRKQGTWKTFYKDGKLKTEANYKDDVLNGQLKEYDENGNLTAFLRYLQGSLLESEDTADLDIEIKNKYDENGHLIYSGSYRDDTPLGIHREYDVNGNVINAYLYNDNGIIIGEGIINNDGKREGEWKDYYLNGDLKAKGSYTSNVRNGKWEFYYENKRKEQSGVYKNGKEDGLWEWYYIDGSIKREEEYYNGLEEGIYNEFDTLGNVIVQGSYFDGMKEGEWIINVGDNVEQGNYVGDLKDGKWQSYYDNGKLKYQGDYIQGNPDGEHIYYYSSGTISELNYYSMGIKVKNWKKFDENGALLITITYKDNREYRINGQKIDFAAEDVRIIR